MQEPDEQKHYTYVLECADGSLYCGYAVDPERRLAQHNAGTGAKYTKSRRPVRLLAVAQFQTKHEALSAEYKFKRLSRARKQELVEAAASEPFEDVLARELGIC